MTKNTDSPRLIPQGSLLQRLNITREKARKSGDLKSIETRQQVIDENGIPFQVRVLCKPRQKPSGFRRLSHQQNDKLPENPFLPYEEALYVGHLDSGHVILLNKYNVVDNHLLIVTPAFKRQESLLSQAEFNALYSVMNEAPLLAFYNSAREAGASQPHCHLQAIPCTQLPIDSLMFGVPDEAQRVEQLPYAHQIRRFSESILPSPEALYEKYLALLEALGLHQPGQDEDPLPHNLLVTGKWMMVIPRKSGRHPAAPINALGFVGLLLAKDDEQLKTIRETGIASILSSV